MITDAELAELPDDPEQAFVGYERKLREKTIDALERSDGGSAETIQLQYINLVIAAARFFGMEFLKDFEVPRVSASNIYESYVQLLSDVDHCTLHLRLRHARRMKQYSVALDAAAKSKIRHHLTKIREIIDKLEIKPSKKEALYSKISSLEEELNRSRTRFEVLASLFLETTDVIGEGAERLEPLRKIFDTISKVFKQAKDAEENSLLSPPPSASHPRIEPPRKKLEGPTHNGLDKRKDGPDLEGDIPF
jgi:hypothetical protein